LLALSFFSFSKPDKNGHNGRCTGSAYCTACSNCSRCGHCGSGGTCGVCSGSSSGRSSSTYNYYSSKKRKSTSSKSKTSNFSTPTTFYSAKKKTAVYQYKSGDFLYDENLLYVVYQTVNIRKGAGKEFPVLKKVKKNTKLILLSEKGDWYKIRVYDSNVEGFVYKVSVR